MAARLSTDHVSLSLCVTVTIFTLNNYDTAHLYSIFHEWITIPKMPIFNLKKTNNMRCQVFKTFRSGRKENGVTGKLHIIFQFSFAIVNLFGLMLILVHKIPCWFSNKDQSTSSNDKYIVENDQKKFYFAEMVDSSQKEKLFLYPVSVR